MTEDEKRELITKGMNPYVDSRGRIDNYELAENVNHIGLITSRKGSLRANHYHPVQEQKCLLISGKYVSVFKDLSSPDNPIRHQIVQAGDLSTIPPQVAHTMIFLEDSVFVNLVKGNRDHDKFEEHTIKCELVKPEEVEGYIKLYS
ncbi:MAG: hypothetical protein AABY22_00265 [Nanoarchaeota archaeon]